MPFPSPPWRMNAQMWLSLIPVRSTGRPDRPGGLYGVAFVDYEEGSVLTYRELLVARLVGEGRSRQVRITDIWVDSEESMAGGRSLWAIPKQLAELSLDDRRGLVSRTHCGGTGIATATFTGSTAAAVVRTPFSSSTSQLREDGSEVRARLHGSAKSLPCLGSWRFDEDGPLGWLYGKVPVLSFRMTDLRLTFG